MPRQYELKRRADRQADTRRRIVDATVALHAEIGPARTTITAIAERAGVERLTVYRHFPDEASLFGACGARFRELHPPPDPAAWAETADPVLRLRRSLTVLYAFYRENEAMLVNSARDAEQLPALQAARAPFGTYLQQLQTMLRIGWETESPFLDAALGHALELPTWQSLTKRQGLTDADAIELIVRTVTALGSGDRVAE